MLITETCTDREREGEIERKNLKEKKSKINKNIMRIIIRVCRLSTYSST